MKRRTRSPRDQKKANARYNRLLTNLVQRCATVGSAIKPGAPVTAMIVAGASQLQASKQISRLQYTQVVAAAKHIRETAGTQAEPVE